MQNRSLAKEGRTTNLGSLPYNRTSYILISPQIEKVQKSANGPMMDTERAFPIGWLHPSPIYFNGGMSLLLTAARLLGMVQWLDVLPGAIRAKWNSSWSIMETYVSLFWLTTKDFRLGSRCRSRKLFNVLKDFRKNLSISEEKSYWDDP